MADGQRIFLIVNIVLSGLSTVSGGYRREERVIVIDWEERGWEGANEERGRRDSVVRVRVNEEESEKYTRDQTKAGERQWERRGGGGEAGEGERERREGERERGGGEREREPRISETKIWVF